jgi:hypothetical protein
VPRGTAGAAVTIFAAKVRVLDFDTVQLDIARALANTATDAEDAVTAACSLLEAVCRSILIELGLPLPAKKDIDGLIRAVQEPLNLSPRRTDLPPEIEQDVRQVLGRPHLRCQGIARCAHMAAMPMAASGLQAHRRAHRPPCHHRGKFVASSSLRPGATNSIALCLAGGCQYAAA